MRELVIKHIQKSRWWKECDDLDLDQPNLDSMSNKELLSLLLTVERLPE